MDYLLLDQSDISTASGVREWEDHHFNETEVSLILVDLPPGGGPRLHRHPYPELFIVHEGEVRFTVGAATVDAYAGQIVIVPKGVAHKFINVGQSILRQTDIHVSKKFVTEWLES